MERHGWIVELKEDKIEEYKKLHKAVWPSVLETIKKCHIQNYSIYLRKMPDGKYYLFAYFEYTGKDFAADMDKMAADPETQKWWKITNPMQQPLPDCEDGDWWAIAEEVFHID